MTAPWARRPHGTTAAYKRHYRIGEKPCESCSQANALARAEQRASTAAVHADRGNGTTRCGRSRVRLAAVPSEVTCRHCKAITEGTLRL